MAPRDVRRPGTAVSNRPDVIVTDASPLITLARAGALDLLLQLKTRIAVPDAVYTEATNPNHADGRLIFSWFRKHLGRIYIVPTEIGLSQTFLLTNQHRAKNFGEYAAIEAIEDFLQQEPEGRVILLYEDMDLARRYATYDPRLTLITTGTMLVELERAGVIASARQVLDDSAATGRNVERLREEQGNLSLAKALREDDE